MAEKTIIGHSDCPYCGATIEVKEVATTGNHLTATCNGKIDPNCCGFTFTVRNGVFANMFRRDHLRPVPAEPAQQPDEVIDDDKSSQPKTAGRASFLGRPRGRSGTSD